MQEIGEIYRLQKEDSEKINKITTEKYSEHLSLLVIQYECLFEFLTNVHELKQIKKFDNDQFILCQALLADCLQKQRIVASLVCSGFYAEAADLTRHVMQASFTLIYLAKNPNSWREWIKQQEYEKEKLQNENARNPGTIFSNFQRLTKSIGKNDYYPAFRKLCAWAHPSMETMRNFFEFEKEGKGPHKYYFTNRFDEEKAEFILNQVFGYTNTSIWEGLKDTFEIHEDLPSSLAKYKEIQEKAAKTFDKFYAVSE